MLVFIGRNNGSNRRGYPSWALPSMDIFSLAGPCWIWISLDPRAIWRLNECVIIPEFNIVDILLISDILLCDLMFIL